MSAVLKRIYILSGALSCLCGPLLPTSALAQIQVSNSREMAKLKHGIEQFQQGHYTLAAQSVTEFLEQKTLPIQDIDPETLNLSTQQAKYILAVSNLKARLYGAEEGISRYISETTQPVYRQKAAFALAQFYFQNNNLPAAIEQYEVAGIDNLSNTEIAEAKFELAYSYFNEKRFEEAKPLFATIKELPDHKYYIAGNYYYGLLAYNDKNYESALKSFGRIHHLDEYKDIVPYYEAEIYYFQGNYEKVLQISNRYLKGKEPAYYDKEMRLLTGQTFFEQKQFKEALPYFEYYYDHSDKIRKEELYELAYTYYMLERWPEAIDKFQPLSDARDSLGQTSMYLLGDCYLKTGDKKGAKNAFGVCADMDYNQSQKEAATFLFAKLSYEAGEESMATRKFHEFLKQYPQSTFAVEAKKLLVGLLAKSSNYAEAFAIMSDMPQKDNATWAIYQQVGLGRAMQLMQSQQNMAADSILNLTLQQPIDPLYEAIAYFWKGEAAYREERYLLAAKFSDNFIERAKGREDAIKRISQEATLPNAYLNVGFAQLALENYGLAKEAFALSRTAKGGLQNEPALAESLLREADAQFMLQDLDKAAQLYDQAIKHNTPNADYAYFQKSLIFGLQGKEKEKIATLQALIDKRPESVYRDEARYELAVSLLEADRDQEAIDILRSLSTLQNGSGPLKAKALAKLGYAYQEMGRNEDAIITLKRYLADYPSATDRPVVVDALRNLYIAIGRPEDYERFLKEQGMPSKEEAHIEPTYYAAAESEYANSKWAKAVEGFGKYLSLFPNGASAIKAHYYRGLALMQMQDRSAALKDFDAVVEAGWSEFAQDATTRAADLAWEAGNYAAASRYYTNLRNVSMEPIGLQKAYMGLMKSAFAQSHYSQAIGYADTLSSLPEVSAAVENEALLFKARSLQKETKWQEAASLYRVIDRANVGAASAEARYRIAELLYLQKKLSDAEQQASYAAQSAGGYDEWVVRSYLLIADILTEQRDYFNAKATLQSIIKNNSDKDIKAEATAKLQKVKNLEKTGSKLKDE